MPYSVRMNSMIDPQNEIETLAIVAPEEVYDGPADDSHMYPDDVEQDEYPW